MTKKPVPEKRLDIIDGFTIKYHANGKTIWSTGKIVDGKADGYWEWYRLDGSIKRSGYFDGASRWGNGSLMTRAEASIRLVIKPVATVKKIRKQIVDNLW